MQYGHGLPNMGSGIAHRPHDGSSSNSLSSAEQPAQSGPFPSNAPRQTAQLQGKTNSITDERIAPIATPPS
jgi:hypothetical protein